MLVSLKNDQDYERALSDAGDRVVLICFTSDLSLHWMQFKPTVEDFAYRYGDINFYKVDADDDGLRSLFNRGGPGVLPSFYFFRRGEEIDSVKGANHKELRCLLEKYTEQKEVTPKCCCCIPLHVAMIIIALLTVYELGYNTYYSVIVGENDGSIVWLVFWFLLKLAAVLSFVYICIRRQNAKARKINFITYCSTQAAEIILICIWFTVAWTTNDYKCAFAVNKCTPSGLCQYCYLLMYPILYLLIAIPFKVWFAWITFRYYRVSRSTAQIRRSLVKTNSSSFTHPYY